MKKITFYTLYVLFSLQLSGQIVQNLLPDFSKSEVDKCNSSINATIDRNCCDDTTNTELTSSSVSYSKPVSNFNQKIGEYSLAIMGSSVPNGQGADSGKGYAQLFADHLAQNSNNIWKTVNISVPGNNTTDVLNRWDNDLLNANTRYVFYGLSLGNEGIHEKGQIAFDSYRDNMQLLIKKSRQAGKIPLIGNNYPRADFNEADYNFLKKMNLLIQQWDVPSVNFLGAIDNGSGNWVTTYQAGNAHPNTSGHAEMYYAIVPSLMDALANGKPQPIKNGNTTYSFLKSDKVKRIAWTPENILHSFTLSFECKTTSTGVLASLTNKNRLTAKLKIGSDGKLVYETQSTSDKLISLYPLNDGKWHQVSLTHYHASGRTFLYLDGVKITNTTIEEKLIPVRFYLNDFTETADADFRELFFHRSAMNDEEISALHAGKMLKSSLEIYAPLNGNTATEKQALQNFAQSINSLVVEEQNCTSPDKLTSNLSCSKYQHQMTCGSDNLHLIQNSSENESPDYERINGNLPGSILIKN